MLTAAVLGARGWMLPAKTEGAIVNAHPYGLLRQSGKRIHGPSRCVPRCLEFLHQLAAAQEEAQPPRGQRGIQHAGQLGLPELIYEPRGLALLVASFGKLAQSVPDLLEIFSHRHISWQQLAGAREVTLALHQLAKLKKSLGSSVGGLGVSRLQQQHLITADQRSECFAGLPFQVAESQIQKHWNATGLVASPLRITCLAGSSNLALLQELQGLQVILLCTQEVFCTKLCVALLSHELGSLQALSSIHLARDFASDGELLPVWTVSRGVH
mmetsp:Transcript_70805/g.134912  ORF Transcript_70805/g.134912 Transcript_70805/m.134912 type:complete len:270 (+) Transcript_70805:1338-2147(+)